VPALPVSLVSHVFLNDPDRVMTGFELKGRVQALIQRLESEGSYVHIPRHDREYAVEVGLRMLVLRHLIIKEHEQYRINPAEKTLLSYYANAIPDFASEPKPAVEVEPVTPIDEELAVIPG
jgi:glycerol-3-phosphate O-acyltransferase